MAASATVSYHVAGPCVLQATVGNGGAYATVGVCEDGIDLEFRNYVREVKADGAGGPDGAPANFVYLNSTLTLRCVLVPFAGVAVNRLRLAADAGWNTVPGTDGVMVQSGTLYASTTTNSLVGVKFTSNDPDGGWTVGRCLVRKSGDLKASPNVSKPVFEFLGINAYDYLTAATILGNTLYTRS